jgi:uncharacterized damage-inducible protein DinB
MSAARMLFPPLTSRNDLLLMLDALSRADLEVWARCREMPIEQLNEPVFQGTWPVIRILAHLAATESYVLECVAQRPNVVLRHAEPDGPYTREAVLTDLDESRAATLAFIKSRQESVLSELCFYGDAGEQTVGGVLFHLIERTIHHRALVLFKLERSLSVHE